MTHTPAKIYIMVTSTSDRISSMIPRTRVHGETSQSFFQRPWAELAWQLASAWVGMKWCMLRLFVRWKWRFLPLLSEHQFPYVWSTPKGNHSARYWSSIWQYSVVENVLLTHPRINMIPLFSIYFGELVYAMDTLIVQDLIRMSNKNGHVNLKTCSRILR